MTYSYQSYLTKPWSYFLATFIWTWGICSIVIIQASQKPGTASLPLLLLAMIGPGVTGILFTYLNKSKSEIRDYWRRVVSIRQVPILWIVLAIFLPFILQLLAGFIDGVSGGAGLKWGESVNEFIQNPASQLLTLFIITLVPFFEELGWRGYAQDQLQTKYSAAKASILLGLIWSIWHLPASFIPGTYQAGLGIGTQEFWLHFIGILFLSIVISWIYINTNRSIFVMVLFHATINASGQMIELSETGETIFTLCWISAAMAILLGLGKEMKLNPKNSQAVTFRHKSRYIGIILLGSAFGLFMQLEPVASQHPSADLQSEIEIIQQEFELPGITAAFLLPDGTIETAATGMADLEFGIVLQPDSRMLAASIGKMWVAAAAVKLHLDNQLNLDLPIEQWLGNRDWFDGLANHKSITLRHLLTHTSGLPNHVETEEFQSDMRKHWLEMALPMPPEELITYILNQPAIHEPGQGWNYSDTGYILAGLAIEEATGTDIIRYIQDEFLYPLNLDLTSPSDRRELKGLASGYLDNENVFGLPVKTTTQPEVLAWHPGIEWTGGGFISNPKDLVTWAKYYFGGNVMSGDYLTLVLDAVPIHEDYQEVRYGLGVAIRHNGEFGTTFGHGGWIPGYCSSLRYYPEQRVALAFQINTDSGFTDPSSNVMDEIESRLTNTLFQAYSESTLTTSHNQ